MHMSTDYFNKLLWQLTTVRIADIVEDFIQVQKYIVHIFKACVHNLIAIVMVHLFNDSVLILMTRGQTGFEG
jgi:hypothetical protein